LLALLSAGFGRVARTVDSFVLQPTLVFRLANPICLRTRKETGMRCPVDNETLVMADRNGVEIDYCPKCRGVWLDRGELDKIIERASAAPSVSPASGSRGGPVFQPEPERPRSREDDRSRSYRPRHDDDDDDDHHRDGYRR
jgi:Zn-finger nucleic acid-binding protein